MSADIHDHKCASIQAATAFIDQQTKVVPRKYTFSSFIYKDEKVFLVERIKEVF